jgi:hypothetical protein
MVCTQWREEEGLLAKGTPKRVLASYQFYNNLIRAVEFVGIGTGPRSPSRTMVVESMS